MIRNSDGGGGGVIATITYVNSGGAGGTSIKRLLRLGSDRGGVMFAGSRHVHSSLEALVQFYQDPKYFAKTMEPDLSPVGYPGEP